MTPRLLSPEYGLVVTTHLGRDEFSANLEPQLVTELMREHPADRPVRTAAAAKRPPNRDFLWVPIPSEPLKD